MPHRVMGITLITIDKPMPRLTTATGKVQSGLEEDRIFVVFAQASDQADGSAAGFDGAVSGDTC
jgi:hypothetical protein